MKLIDYTYDNLSRLIEADYSTDRNYQYAYDLAGNRTYQETTIGITTTTTDWTYNNANQMATMQIGANPVINMSFDNNGNLTDDGVLTYTWNRANRLKTLNNGTYNTHFAYDGNGDRHQQNVGGTITNYLLDVQPELALVLGETVSSATIHYVHSPMGIHSAYDGSDWVDMLQDGLGSVRAQVDATAAIVADRVYDPYGQMIDDNGTWLGSFGYAGEQTDESGLGYNRARYYNPAMGAFASLDPFEGIPSVPMSMNGYGYVHGNPVNLTDPDGQFPTNIGQVATFLPEAIIMKDNNLCFNNTPQLLSHSDLVMLANSIADDLVKPLPIYEIIALLLLLLALGLLTNPILRSWLISILNELIEKVKNPPKTKSPGGCNSIWSATKIGEIAHRQIQAYFMSEFPTDGDFEVNIANAGRNGGTGYADLVLRSEGRLKGDSEDYVGIYEIKPISYSPIEGSATQFADAVEQLGRYVSLYPKDKQYQGQKAVRGTYWNPNGERVGLWHDDFGQDLILETSYNFPLAQGLVFYYCRRNNITRG